MLTIASIFEKDPDDPTAPSIESVYVGLPPPYGRQDFAGPLFVHSLVHTTNSPPDTTGWEWKAGDPETRQREERWIQRVIAAARLHRTSSEFLRKCEAVLAWMLNATLRRIPEYHP